MTAQIKLLLNDKIFKSGLPESQAKARKTVVNNEESTETKTFGLTHDEHSENDSIGEF